MCECACAYVFHRVCVCVYVYVCMYVYVALQISMSVLGLHVIPMLCVMIHWARTHAHATPGIVEMDRLAWVRSAIQRKKPVQMFFFATTR